MSPEGRRALVTESPLDRLSTREFLAMRDTAGIRTLVLAGLQWTLLLFALGGVTTVAGIDTGIESDVALWDTAAELLGASLLLLVVERVARGVRDRYGPFDVLPAR